MNGPLGPILVVDDAAEDTYLIRRTLKRAGIDAPVIGCGDGAEAVQFMESAAFGGQRPSLVLLDLRMPRMDGFAFLEWLGQHPGLSDIRVVVMSTSTLEEDRHRALALGARDYLVKFPSPEQLGAQIRHLLAASEPTPA